MGRRRVKADDLAEAVSDILKSYGDDVEAALPPVLKKTAQTARAELRAESPRKTGAYAKGWQYSASPDGLHYTLYNGPHARLTHLLENGHVIRNGTDRVYGVVPGREHVKPVEKKILETLPAAVVSALHGT